MAIYVMTTNINDLYYLVELAGLPGTKPVEIIIGSRGLKMTKSSDYLPEKLFEI